MSRPNAFAAFALFALLSIGFFVAIQVDCPVFMFLTAVGGAALTAMGYYMVVWLRADGAAESWRSKLGTGKR